MPKENNEKIPSLIDFFGMVQLLSFPFDVYILVVYLPKYEKNNSKNCKRPREYARFSTLSVQTTANYKGNYIGCVEDNRETQNDV